MAVLLGAKIASSYKAKTVFRFEQKSTGINIFWWIYYLDIEIEHDHEACFEKRYSKA